MHECSTRPLWNLLLKVIKMKKTFVPIVYCFVYLISSNTVFFYLSIIPANHFVFRVLINKFTDRFLNYLCFFLGPTRRWNSSQINRNMSLKEYRCWQSYSRALELLLVDSIGLYWLEWELVASLWRVLFLRALHWNQYCLISSSTT